MRSPFLAAPPSTRSTRRLLPDPPPLTLLPVSTDGPAPDPDPVDHPAAAAAASSLPWPMSARIASSTSLACQAMASSMARARCALVLKPVRPRMAPRAVSSQCGARSPENAGTMYTPPVSGTELARFSNSVGSVAMPMLSHIQLMPRPATATAPSSAYCMGSSGPSLKEVVVSRPCLDWMAFGPVLSSMKQPVPYVFLASPSTHRWPSSAAIWSPRQPEIGMLCRAPCRSAVCP
mmetsp:Transcript_37426/g.94451  ORF Transcript_37426/g.94451 Transcript_37426/m.94451 type:complete len:234 (+) Transcript_37426:525-1226(+)